MSSSSSVPSVNNVVGKNITVNLNVSVDAAGEIQVFGAPEEVLTNVLYAEYKMDVKALYSTDANGVQSGLIEFWEPSTALGDISVAYADDSVNGVLMKETQAKLVAQELQKVLVNAMDARNPASLTTVASPFSDIKYKDSNGAYIETYVKHREFGRLALSAYAHYIFGHQAATSAITNDKAFVENMLSLTDKGQDLTTAAERYAVWNKAASVTADLVSAWSDITSTADANIALRLAKAICSKTTTANVSTATALAGDLANIVKQVIGQDATRAMGQDNNQLLPDVKQKLVFYAGDKIVVSIKLAAPTVTLGPSQNAGIASSLYDKDGSAGILNEETYAIVITLEDKVIA
jgi:hypothetical protein